MTPVLDQALSSLNTLPKMTCRYCASQAPPSPDAPRTQGALLVTQHPELGVVLALAVALLAVPSSPAEDQPIRIHSFRLLDQTAHLEWEGGSPPFRVQASRDCEFSWFDISGYLFGNSYDSRDPSTFIFFRVRSAVDSAPPMTPTPLQVSAARCDRITLTWQPAADDLDGSGLAGYRLYRDGARIAQLPSPTRFFLDKGVVPESNYVYTVSSVDRVGNESMRSAPINFATSACVEQAGPHGELRLAWDPSDDPEVAGYLVYWGLAPQDYLWVMDAMDYTSASIPDLAPDVTYFFAVTAYDHVGAQSDLSVEAAGITAEVYVTAPP